MFSITAATPSSFPQTYEKESMEADISSPYSHLLQNLSFLKSKVQEAQSLLTLMLPPNNQHHQTLTTSITLVAQDIISVASSVMPTITNPSHNQHESQQTPHDNDISEGYCDIIELDASDLLAKYTHYCQVCGKGFMRDANLRMHMRAHGDEYKSIMALKKPFKEMNIKCCYYSCPLEGCRWNKKHARFRPLKSLVCTKNHYKRSHCPKIYLCKRCNCKQFAVLSDLRTHEKHCGDAGVKWQCTCGVGFSRKDKLLGHVSLFGGGHRAVLP